MGACAVMLAPMSFSRGMEWAPFAGLADYVRDVKRVRDRLADTVFLGVSRGATEVDLGEALPDGVQYNTFVDRAGTQRACILSNGKAEPRTVSFAGFSDPRGRQVRVHVPGRGARVMKLPARITLAPERLAFVEEMGEDR